MRGKLVVVLMVLGIVGATAGPVTGATSSGREFVVRCSFPTSGGSAPDIIPHLLQDDPIAYPQSLSTSQGAAHWHTFFGNQTTKWNSTYAGMQGQHTSCVVSTDTAAYWSPQPALNGTPFFPHGEHSDNPKLTPGAGDDARVYYTCGEAGSLSGDCQNTAVPPKNLRLIGNGGATSPPGQDRLRWFCGASSTSTPVVNHPYSCQPFIDGTDTYGKNGGPTCPGGGTTPPGCKFIDGIVGIISFQQCLIDNDGNSTTVSYVPDGVNDTTNAAYEVNNKCPAGYPVHLPDISLRVHFGIVDPCPGVAATSCSPTNIGTVDPTRGLTGNVKLTFAQGSSCNTGTTCNLDGPYWTLHGDFWNTWLQTGTNSLRNLVMTCLVNGPSCGFLPHS